MSIVAEKMRKKMKAIQRYQIENHFDFNLSFSDATYEQMENNTVPIFEVNGKKMGKTAFFEIIEKVEEKVFEKKTNGDFLLKGKIISNWAGDKWNPVPTYDEYVLSFKCWNYSFD